MVGIFIALAEREHVRKSGLDNAFRHAGDPCAHPRIALFLLNEPVSAQRVNDPDTFNRWHAQQQQAQQ